MRLTGAPYPLFFEIFKGLARESLAFARQIGAEGLVVSPTPEIGILMDLMEGMGIDECKAQYLPQITELVDGIGAEAAQYGIQVAVRNEFWGLLRGTGIEDLLSETDAKNVLFSPDLAQLAIAGADPGELIRKYAGRIAFVHFSDTWYVDEGDNYMSKSPEAPVAGAQRVYCDLGDGMIDVPACHRALREAGYDGWVLCGSKSTLNVYRALLKTRWYLDNVISDGGRTHG
jgi:inosose dehydratase